MKPSQVLKEVELRTLDYETVVDCHFVTPPPGKKENRIVAYCRRCKRKLIQFSQDDYDEKFVQKISNDMSQAHQEMVRAWWEHECDGLKQPSASASKK